MHKIKLAIVTALMWLLKGRFFLLKLEAKFALRWYLALLSAHFELSNAQDHLRAHGRTA